MKLPTLTAGRSLGVAARRRPGAPRPGPGGIGPALVILGPYLNMPAAERNAIADDVETACGTLGNTARSEADSPWVEIVQGWHADQYAGDSDPNEADQHPYGLHLTLETRGGNKSRLKSRWHLYQSGAVYEDRGGKGNDIVYRCNGPSLYG
ncbi:MAG: hypothetical protein H6739_18325 [Alphaproteobacteria bacterium]|nr:hypothetical protein [Alphaproteobacteria bacterium]